MILVELRDAIRAELALKISALREVKTHGGRFDLAEIKKAAAKSPSARVTCLGLRNIRFAENIVKADALCAVFVIASDLPGARRDATALTIIAAIAALLPNNCWGLEDSVNGADDGRADNLFSKALDDTGIALWALTFTHQVDLDPLDMATIDDFLLAHVDYDIAPADGKIEVTDEIELEGP